MTTWIKRALQVAVVLIPGGLLLLLGWGVGRALRTGYRTAVEQAPGEPVDMRQVIAALTVRNIVREALSY